MKFYAREFVCILCTSHSEATTSLLKQGWKSCLMKLESSFAIGDLLHAYLFGYEVNSDLGGATLGGGTEGG